MQPVLSQYDDVHWMRRAIALARLAWGQTHPNPMVGALIVDSDGVCLGEGYHAKAGEPHAEVNAFHVAQGKDLSRATLYVTLEPCCTHGRTPPCTDAILRSGIRRVIVGAVDPNPAHSGHGLTLLRDAGLSVTEGVLAEECLDLNLIFNHWMSRKSPLFAAKLATTIDGRVATRAGESKWISGAESRADVMRWRRYFPAIAVGAGTLIADNPQLTSRQSGIEPWCPVRFVFDRTGKTALHRPSYQVYSDTHAVRTVVVHGAYPDRESIAHLDQAGVQHWEIPGTGAEFWMTFRKHCMAAGINGVFFEGGPRLVGDLLSHQQMDYLLAYRAPLIFADSQSIPAIQQEAALTKLAMAPRLTRVHHDVFGEDSLMRGFVKYYTHD
ncbi:MAG: bifunctional diaminohydroxyphosphoribosylaminopyrimidine deaminase/5-amino-6-(5-phosphoribosylamino)uracil reductase RibD [Verrucomicrobiota bacterium]|nr:bifunctional diaminohydroxyphosphoribosylaminopyrimidine deaminase/5-amino-6-(5-phosphoribosylamino)uracil reductase RibD [Verrucomicrobiota bacterium]